MSSKQRRHDQFEWTPELIDKAAEIWNEGGISAEQIGRIFGVSRNAVIGIANRHKDRFKKKSTGSSAPRKPRKPRQPPANQNINANIAPNWNSNLFRRPVQAQSVSGSDLGEMVNEWIARNGEPRRFPRGFSGDWVAIRNRMYELGWDLKMSGSWYSMLPLGSGAKLERLTRDAILAKIDGVLIANGQQPFLRREMEAAE